MKKNNLVSFLGITFIFLSLVYTEAGRGEPPLLSGAVNNAGREALKYINTSKMVKIKIGDQVKAKLTRRDRKNKYGMSYDRYEFSGKANNNISINMASSKVSNYLYLYKKKSSGLKYLGENGGSESDANLTYVLPKKGKYVIYAGSLIPGDFGKYTLSLAKSGSGNVSGKLFIQDYITINEDESNNDFLEPQEIKSLPVIVFGEAASTDDGFKPSEFSPTLHDFYSLDGSFAVSFSLESSDEGADFDLFLFDENGVIIDSSENTGNDESVSYNSLFDYSPAIYIVVSAVSGSGGYKLKMDYVNNATVSGTEKTEGGNGELPEFVPGEAVIKYKNSTNNAGAQSSKGSVSYRVVSSPEEKVKLIHFDFDSLNAVNGSGRTAAEKDLKLKTLEMIEKLKKDENVEYAEPNYIYRAMKTPNDKQYSRQWHYNSIGLPAAWNVTTGSDNIIVAVIDTGIVSAHPDFSGRLTSGYDFIRDKGNSLDGDGIDSDPEDPGDDPKGKDSSYHGTHVAGTVGAATNNTTGVAGVTWSGKIMSIRVLGAEGGTTYDIAQGIRYAAGLKNDSGKKPASKADVINMSLGGSSYSDTMADAVADAIGAGVTVVAAAGNSSSSEYSYPASYDDVISVGAVDYKLNLSYYSNYGDKITVVAPGGDTKVDLNNDGYKDGVLSTIKFDETDKLGYTYYQGTSMASPHVAGVVSLMQAAREAEGLGKLTPSEVAQILIDTATDLGASGKDNLYGYGLINAGKAVKKAINSTGGGDSPSLSVSSDNINFGSSQNQVDFTVSNSGGGTLTLNSITSTEEWLTITPTITSTISAGASVLYSAVVDRTGLSDGRYSASIEIQSDGGDKTIPVSMQIGESSERDIGMVFVLAINSDTFQTEAQDVTDLLDNYDFSISDLVEGNYVIVAGTDRDNDLYVCDEGEACGFYPTVSDPQLVPIEADMDTTGIDFTVEEQVALFNDQLTALLKKSGGKGFRLLKK